MYLKRGVLQSIFSATSEQQKRHEEDITCAFAGPACDHVVLASVPYARLQESEASVEEAFERAKDSSRGPLTALW
jgi:hypothetical protein